MNSSIRIFPVVGAAFLGLTAVQGIHAADPSFATAPTALLRAQATSGVNWHPWSDATIAAAAKQEKPVYVFVASELSGLSRATIAQTFTSEKTIAWINEEFFPIFVDEDVRPDVAAYAQHYINSAKQMRGVPVHLWLTPDMRPFDGANYLPPSEEWGRPGFLKAARAALDSFKAGPQQVNALVDDAMSMMRLTPIKPDASDDATARLASATEAWIAAADKVHGGFGTAPKNPEPELIRFMLRRGDAAREVAVAAARAIVNGALRDPVDGGFYRRCIDEAWKEPFHQKLLSDQARIAIALFDAADAAKDDKVRAAGVGALEFALKELRNPDGSFAAALDGTIDENPDPKQRMKFVKVGRANPGTLRLLVAALERSGEPRLVSQSAAVGARDAVSKSGATPVADYFDPKYGRFMATSQTLPPGIAFRAPAAAEPLSAEVLALLAGVDAATAKAIRLGLLSAIEYDELPPGDVLLALSQK